MRRKFLLAAGLAVLLTSPSFSAEEPKTRERLSLDAGWRFHLGDLAYSSGTFDISGWQWKDAGKENPGVEGDKIRSVMADKNGWKKAAPGEDVFGQKTGFAWYKTSLPDAPGPGRVLRFTAVDDNCTVFLNGQKLLVHEGWSDPFDVPLDPAWRSDGRNELLLLVQNTGGPGMVKEAELASASAKDSGPALADYDDASWRKVHLPHDFVVEGTFDPKADGSHGFLPKGVGWYRKAFEVPASDKGRALWIDFDGVYRNCKVWLNGKPLGGNLSGYTSFRFDVTDALNYGGPNVLSVRADARGSEGWWYEGGGIYRHVWLHKSEPVHVAPWGVYVVSNPEDGGASVDIQTTLANGSDADASLRLVSEVQDAGGKTVLKLSAKAAVPKGSEKTFKQSGKFPDVKLWDLENPYLYRLVTTLQKDKKPLDSVTTSFGVRSIRFDKDQGFFLNGKPVKLKGTCNHQDFAGIGIAIPERVFNYRVQRLKDMGSNAYRCSHNPPAAELLDACDRMGLLVMDENRRLNDSPEFLSQLKSMVLRDRNHPSVILWSLCNEEGRQGTEEGRKIGQNMKDLILQYDKTRLVTCAMNGGYGEGLSHVVDLQGFNYHVGEYDPFRKSHPDMPLFGSETASTVSTRGIYANDKVKGYVSAYDVNYPDWANTAEQAWAPLAERPWMAGGFVWTGFDYRGEPTPYGWPCINSHFGIMDMCGFPKDNFYYYQAWWGGKPVLHLLPHWNWKGKEGKEIEVWALGNSDKVELFLNGESLGVKDMPPNGHVEWKVKYQPGVLSAKGTKDGKVVAEDKVETTGVPTQVKLQPYQDWMVSDGEDVMPVAVSILDEKGRVVPTADNEVAFRVEGPGEIAGVANGDPSSHEPDKADKRKVFNGLCMVLVRSGEKPGEIRLVAESKGLQAATVTFYSADP